MYEIKNPQLALRALLRKKYYEKRSEHIDELLNKSAKVKGELQDSTWDVEGLQVMSAGGNALKKLHAKKLNTVIKTSNNSLEVRSKNIDYLGA